MFLYEKFIHHKEPLEELSEADLLQASEEYLAVHPSNEAGSCTEDHPEPSQDGPTEVGVPGNTWQCGWMDETTNRRCPELVPAGLQPMLSHLNTVHNVCGSERISMECKWAVPCSGYEFPCGNISQRRNIPRHIAKHLGLRYGCKLCGKDFARSDLLKYHERKDH
ncbi:hypothetical protein DFJ58DRAFT_792848 [Suillus subalutaceus]|uniref:uncharacterized protein n=1 Tax=Suillus subalutaceus TaxID=48586 RepID=UPI001B86ACE4|nr:uncharacterized protein DFJ58DRAFT_792848 [Suillus subalutaceus]KAG1851334.1 hypothetical protein DFJ58DRAFT_792848 [Suillus subalutaceus]